MCMQAKEFSNNDPYEEWEKQTRKDALVSLEIHS